MTEMPTTFLTISLTVRSIQSRRHFLTLSAPTFIRSFSLSYSVTYNKNNNKELGISRRDQLPHRLLSVSHSSYLCTMAHTGNSTYVSVIHY